MANAEDKIGLANGATIDTWEACCHRRYGVAEGHTCHPGPNTHLTSHPCQRQSKKAEEVLHSINRRDVASPLHAY